MDNLGTNKMQSKGHFYFVFKQEMSGGNAFYCFMGFLLNMPGQFSTFFLQINPLLLTKTSSVTTLILFRGQNSLAESQFSVFHKSL